LGINLHFCITITCRGFGTLAHQKKPRKAGRPKLPKGVAKGKIVPVRFSQSELKEIESAAKAKNQTISEWVRSAVGARLGKKQ
jgi:hypothetical protein